MNEAQQPLFDDGNHSLIMPAEYYGETNRSGGFTKTQPREWTDQELTWIQDKLTHGFTVAQIAEAINRSPVSVSIKLKRQKKTADTYNEKHRDQKYTANQAFLNQTKPNTLLDVYAGHSFYLNKGIKQVTTNDLNPDCPTDYHLDALTLLCKLYAEGNKYDVIDLDPFGSAYDCIDLTLKMAKKGVIISFGEWGHKRWKRYDYVRPRYGISNETEFTSHPFIEEVQRIAETNKKTLNLVECLQYGNFLRAYFTIERHRITEQWEQPTELQSEALA